MLYRVFYGRVVLHIDAKKAYFPLASFKNLRCNPNPMLPSSTVGRLYAEIGMIQNLSKNVVKYTAFRENKRQELMIK